ncbi:homeobox-containing protein 1 isoform X5 [Girardinichthys multiradiatus]|uniref:homeobox-containing protein 1 isoform X5 n=1 Tax=Girardinichthys multiradiatus TaxID=208333 RepID=UPI001FADCABE|nr:homeobox-containing protein 1 isoform X5 [Girardinichthys multiradiatus]
MRQWSVPTATPRAEPLPGCLSVSPPPSVPRMEGGEVEPRYTIEQIDLLQRLRLSGMTKPQIIHALESLERLDPEHRLPHCDSHPAPSNNGAPATAAPAQSSSSSSSSSSSLSLASATTQTSGLDGAALSPSNSYEASPPPLYPPSVVVQRAFSYDIMGEEEWDLEEKVEEYMRRDSNLVKEEIKTFLNNRRISQAIVGQVTGISQSYISQWLLQQGLEMSDSKRRAFYRWYLLERNNPGATLSMRSLVKEEPDWRTGIIASDRVGIVGGPLRLRRGSRFTWRKECQSIMESFFMENQYPDEGKREEIANACNSVIQKPGCKLSEFERVTALKVYNWFANRRKEMKRRANIAAILESHGIEVPSPSCHSNGEEGELQEFVDQVNHRFSEKEDTTSQKIIDQQDRCSLTTGEALAPPSPQGVKQKDDDSERKSVDEE